MLLVDEIHLLEEDEGEDGVGSQTHVVWREALPEREEALIADHLAKDVQRTLVLWLSVSYLHVLDSVEAGRIRSHYLEINDSLKIDAEGTCMQSELFEGRLCVLLGLSSFI